MEDINNALITLAVGIVLLFAVLRIIHYKHALALLGVSLSITAYFILTRQDHVSVNRDDFDLRAHDFYTILWVLWSLLVGAVSFVHYRAELRRKSADDTSKPSALD